MLRLIVLASLILTSALSAAQQVLEIIPLKHRLVGDVLPSLQQLVSPGGTVTGMNDQLIIRTDADNLAQLKAVLAALDTRLRQLRITVRQGIQVDQQFSENEIEGRLRSGDLSGRVGDRHRGASAKPGVSIGIGDGDNRIDYRHFNTRRQDDDSHQHFVTTIEGTPAFINAGQVVPLADQNVFYGPYGTSVRDSVRYRNVGAGFYVTPRVVGDDGVNLEISPYAEKLNQDGGGVIDSRGLSTVTSGRLGEWIPLGGAAQSNNQSGGAIGYSTQQSGRDTYDVWVKVEVVR